MGDRNFFNYPKLKTSVYILFFFGYEYVWKKIDLLQTIDQKLLRMNQSDSVNNDT